MQLAPAYSQHEHAEIFISYKREDEAFARFLRDYLLAQNFTVWLDVFNIRPATQWDTEIHRGMINAQVVIGILTPESLISDNVMDEWGWAVSTKKRLFLLWLRDVDEAYIPPRYIRIQRIDLRRDQNAGLQRLSDALRSSIKVVPGLVLPDTFFSESVSPAEAKITPSNVTPRAVAKEAQGNRAMMLAKVKSFWIDGVLNQSLHGTAMLELGIQMQSGMVKNPWDSVFQHSAYGNYQLPPSTKISSVFHDLNGELLILGDPGSGKTTTLLELARERIEIAEQDESAPIPIVLNLSSWAEARKPIKEWLIDELHTKYLVPRQVGQAWLENNALLLLLDGLDEVVERYRNECVATINEFRKAHGFTRLVVCSRTVDYGMLTAKLQLSGAVVLQPLNDEQINQYFAELGDSMRGVRQAMARDPDLRKLAETPLMVSIMALAFRGTRAEDLPTLDSLEAQRRRLFETYTRRMFERRPPRTFSRERIMQYVTWLAGRMVEHKQSVFYIENLQADWLMGDIRRGFFHLLSAISYAAVGGLVLGLLCFLALLAVGSTIDVSRWSDLDQRVFDSFQILLIPAFVGGILFSLGGLSGFAREITFSTFNRKLVKRIGIATLTGTGLGVMTALFFIFGDFFRRLLVDGSFENAIDSYSSFASGGELIRGINAFVSESSGTFIFLVLAGALFGTCAGITSYAIHRASDKKNFWGTLLQCINLVAPVSAVLAVPYLLLWESIFIPNILFFVAAGTVCGALIVLLARLLYKRYVAPYLILLVVSASFIAIIAFQPLALLFGLPFVPIVLWVARLQRPIESVESLRWVWSWRGVFAGALGMALLTLVFSLPAYLSLEYYTPEEEIEARTRIAEYEDRIQQSQTILDETEAELQAMTNKLDNPDAIIALGVRRLWLSTNLAWVEGDFSTLMPRCLADLDVYEQLTLPGQTGNELYNVDFGNTNYVRSLIQDTEQQLSSYSIELSFVERLSIVAIRHATCQTNIETYPIYIDEQKRFNTLDGLNAGFSGSVRFGLIIGLAPFAVLMLVFGLRRQQKVDARVHPNQGIRRSAQNALRVTAISAGVGLLAGGIIGFALSALPPQDVPFDEDILAAIGWVGTIVGLTFGGAVGFIVGGSDSVIKHAILRFFMERNGNTPRNYATFLDEQANRLLLRKVGGGYIFVHRYLLEYFASLEQQSSQSDGDNKDIYLTRKGI